MFSVFVRTLLVYTAILSTVGQPMQQSPMLFEDTQKPSSNNIQLAAPEDVGAQVQAVLLKMKKETPKGLHLNSAVLSLQWGSAVEKSITLTFVIFTFAHKSKMGTTQTTVITFGNKELAAFEANFTSPKFDEQFKQQLDQAVAVSNVVTVLGTKQI